MSSSDRRRAAVRRAWGRGPVILRFEPLEGRQLMAAAALGPGADIRATSFNSVHTANWGDRVEVTGTFINLGTATTTAPVEVDIYASNAPSLTSAGAVGTPVGVAVIPAGLAPGAANAIDAFVNLPPAVPGAKSTVANPTIYLTEVVDPYSNVAESNVSDKQGLGLGVNTSAITIAQHQLPALEGKAIAVTPLTESSPGTLSWGDTFRISEQITNQGVGDAPPTRARIVLTPAGAAPGGTSDVTIGNIAVPAIPAFQSTNVVQTVTLPAVEPAMLNGAGQFTISIVQDADFLTQPTFPRIADQGPGLDQGPIGIAPGPNAAAAAASPPALPDLAPAGVVASQSALTWGEPFQVGAVIQNVGTGNAGSFRVRFVATGVTGDLSHGIFLGDAIVTSGLAAGAATSVLANVELPAKLPYGTSLANPAYAQIYAIVDPDDEINMAMRSNNMASSAPVLLTVLTADGSTPTTVPTYPQNIYTSAALAAQAAKQATLGTPKPAASKPKKHKVNLLASISESVTNTIVKQIKAIPSGVNSLLKDIGASGSSGTSSGTSTATSTSTASSTAASTTTATPTVTTNPYTGAPMTNPLASNGSGFSANGTSGGNGGFGASGV